MTGDEYCGSICIFAGSYAPAQFTLCDGSPHATNSMAALYSILSTTFGGDGRSTFNVPDFRGRFAMHAGQGVGLTQRAWGSMPGQEQYEVQVTADAMPAHSHYAIFASNLLNVAVTTQADLSSFQITGTLLCNMADGNRGPYQGYPGVPTSYPAADVWANTANDLMAPDAIQDGSLTLDAISTTFTSTDIPAKLMAAGQSQAFNFDNTTPYTTLNFLINYGGPYPPHP